MSLLLAAGSAPPASSAPLWVYQPPVARLDWPEADRASGTNLNPLYFWRTTLQVSNGLWSYTGGRNPTLWDEPARLYKGATDALYFWRTPIFGNYPIASLSPVLVTEDVVFRGTDTNSALLFFNRSVAQVVRPFAVPANRPWDFAEDFRPKALDVSILYFWRTQIPVLGGHVPLGVLSPTFVLEDVQARGVDHNQRIMFFGRVIPTPPPPGTIPHVINLGLSLSRMGGK